MKISMYEMSVGSFVPMLKNLSALLDKAAEHHTDKAAYIMSARLAPDMFNLAQQVRIACDHAKNGVSRLIGKEPQVFENNETTLAELKIRIARTIDFLNTVTPAEFEGSDERLCEIPLPNKIVVALSGLQLLQSWALPNFYFHLVTAYNIFRHNDVAIGKQDYLGHLAPFIRSAQ